MNGCLRRPAFSQKCLELLLAQACLSEEFFEGFQKSQLCQEFFESAPQAQTEKAQRINKVPEAGVKAVPGFSDLVLLSLSDETGQDTQDVAFRNGFNRVILSPRM